MAFPWFFHGFPWVFPPTPHGCHGRPPRWMMPRRVPVAVLPWRCATEEVNVDPTWPRNRSVGFTINGI